MLPAISGTATEGQTLTTTNGSWTNIADQLRVSVAALRHGGASCVAISGATAGTYTLVAADAGKTIRVVVTATNGSGDSLPGDLGPDRGRAGERVRQLPRPDHDRRLGCGRGERVHGGVGPVHALRCGGDAPARPGYLAARPRLSRSGR